MTEHGIDLTEDEADTLRIVAGYMIPASVSFGMPGAGDAAIFSDIVASLGQDAPLAKSALAKIVAMCGRPLGRFDDLALVKVLTRFRAEHAKAASILEMVVARCYYRNDTVMRSIGMEPRPPFPEGFEVQQGDWSLLDPVRERGKIYRDV